MYDICKNKEFIKKNSTRRCRESFSDLKYVIQKLTWNCKSLRDLNFGQKKGSKWYRSLNTILTINFNLYHILFLMHRIENLNLYILWNFWPRHVKIAKIRNFKNCDLTWPCQRHNSRMVGPTDPIWVSFVITFYKLQTGTPHHLCFGFGKLGLRRL